MRPIPTMPPHKPQVTYPCDRCGRHLKHPKSREIGMGPGCLKKWRASTGQMFPVSKAEPR